MPLKFYSLILVIAAVPAFILFLAGADAATIGWTFSGIVLFFAASVFLLAPLDATGSSVGHLKTPGRVVTPEKWAKVPPEIREPLEAMRAEAEAKGFVDVVRVHSRGVKRTTQIWLIVARSADARSSLSLVGIRHQSEFGTRRRVYAALSTTDVDHRWVVTSNARITGGFLVRPHVLGVTAPGLSVPELCDLHAHRVATTGLSTVLPVDTAKHPMEHEQASWDADARYHVRRGWLLEDLEGKCYRWTEKGAYLFVWRMLPPTILVRRWLAWRDARAALKDFRAAGGAVATKRAA